MEIKDTREKMNIPEGGICLNEELIIEKLLSKGGSSYTYRAKKKDSEYVILKEYYPLGQGIYTRDKDGFLKYNGSLEESKKSEEQARLDKWVYAEEKIAEIAYRGKESNSDCTFWHEKVKLKDEKTKSAFIEIRTVSGRTLDEWLKEKNDGQKGEMKIKMLKNICSAVDSLHKKGIIHCDLKPQNIYISDHDHVYILDFGTSIYRSKDEIIYSEEGLGGISEGYSSFNIRSLSHDKFPDNIELIDESDDIYSIIQILFYMFLGKTDAQIRSAITIEKSAAEYIEELAGCHLEAQHLLCIRRLLEPRNKKLLKMSNIQRCLEDLQHTEAMLADEKTHVLSELVKSGTFHNLRSLLVLIGKITCAVKDSKPYGKRFLLDSRDILLKGSLESDYTVAVASIKAIPGLDGTASDEKENVRKIRLLLRELIENSKEPICDGINCVGRRKLEKLLDDENFLNYDEFNNAIEELKNYSDPELTYFETNAEEPIIRQSFDLISGDWDRIIGFLRSDGRSNTFHTNNYAAFINQLIERLQADENGIICVLKYDDNIDEMIERIPVTIPYDNGYGVTSIVSDNLEIKNDGNLYIVIWGVKEKKKKIYDFLNGEKGKLNNNNSKKKVNYVYIDDKLSNAGDDFIYKNMDIEEIDLNNTFSILKCIEKNDLYGISYDGIKYAIENIGKDESVIDELIHKQYIMLICGQVYISSRVSSELKGKYEQKEWEAQSLDMLEKIFHYIVSKPAYNYNDELTMIGILKIFGNMIKVDIKEIKLLFNNVKNIFLFNNMTELIVKNTHEVKNQSYEKMTELQDVVTIDSMDDNYELKKLNEKYNCIIRTENSGLERELNDVIAEFESKAYKSNILLEKKRYVDETEKLKDSVIDICKKKLNNAINVGKFEDERSITCLNVICRLVFNDYNAYDLFPIYYLFEYSATMSNEKFAYTYYREKRHNSEICSYLFTMIENLLGCIKDSGKREKLCKMYVYTILSQLKLGNNGLIKVNNYNIEKINLLTEYMAKTVICDIPAIEVLRLMYYSWEKLYSDELFQLIILKSSNRFVLVSIMIHAMCNRNGIHPSFANKSNLKVYLYNRLIDQTKYINYSRNAFKYSDEYTKYRLMFIAQTKDNKLFENMLSYATRNKEKIIPGLIKNICNSRTFSISDIYIITNIRKVFDEIIHILNADLCYCTNDYKLALENYERTSTYGLLLIEGLNWLMSGYINKYKYNIHSMHIYINFMKNECSKIIQMEEIVNIIGPDRFNMDNLDRKNFVRQGKALVDEIHELVLQRGYGFIDSTIISFMMMYKLMRYLYELGDRVTYEKYYNLLSNKIKYCRKNYRDCIVYDNGTFIRLTEQQMVDCMITIEKYRFHKTANDYTKLVLLEKIVDKIGSDKFNMDNLDREDFVDSGKALVEEINKLALQEGYSDNDSTIISFMTMYELMRYLYELDDRATYEKYYALLSGKIKYHKKISSDCIVYYKGRFVILTYSEMTDYMINIEKYRKKFDED